MRVHVPTWMELVEQASGVDAATAARAHLVRVPWLRCVGRASDRDAGVVRVADWADAFRMFDAAVVDLVDRTRGTSPTGTLNAALWPLLSLSDRFPELYEAPTTSAHRALDEMRGYVSAVGAAVAERMPPGVDSTDHELALSDYVTDYVRFLHLEIFLGERLERPSTYFRYQLGWWVAGFLPCGWDGPWPNGAPRVY